MNAELRCTSGHKLYAAHSLDIVDLLNSAMHAHYHVSVCEHVHACSLLRHNIHIATNMQYYLDHRL